MSAMRAKLDEYKAWIASSFMVSDEQAIEAMAQDILNVARTFPLSTMSVVAVTLAMITLTTDLEESPNEEVPVADPAAVSSDRLCDLETAGEVPGAETGDGSSTH